MDEDTSGLPSYADLRARIESSDEGSRWITYRMPTYDPRGFDARAESAWWKAIAELAGREGLTLIRQMIDDIGYESATLMTPAEVRRRNEAILAYYEELLAHYKRNTKKRIFKKADPMAIEMVRIYEEKTSSRRSELT